MKIFYTLFIIVVVPFLFTECETGRTTTEGMSVTGKVGEILVVCDKAIWDSPIQETLDSQLVKYILPYLPDVPTFNLTHRTPKHFTQGVKRFRNTLFLKIDPKYSGEYGKIEKRKDVWAKGQLVIDVVGKDYNQLIETCRKGLDKVHDEFDDASWRRLLNNFKRNKSTSTNKAIQNNFGIDIVFPSGSKLVTKRPNFYRVEFPEASRPIEFVGVSEDVGTILSGVMIYQYQYRDSSQFEFEELLKARDTMLRYNAPSEIEGMYMGTQYNQIVYPEGNPISSIYNVQGYEMRGMFVFKGRQKFGTGGAFWAFHFVHPKRNKLICVSGYVDAPATTTWTHPIREIEAVLRSVKFVE